MLCHCTRHIILYLVLVPHRKRLDMTENCRLGFKAATQITGPLLLSGSVLELRLKGGLFELSRSKFPSA